MTIASQARALRYYLQRHPLATMALCASPYHAGSAHLKNPRGQVYNFLQQAYISKIELGLLNFNWSLQIPIRMTQSLPLSFNNIFQTIILFVLLPYDQ